jgi:hypothetical protein
MVVVEPHRRSRRVVGPWSVLVDGGCSGGRSFAVRQGRGGASSPFMQRLGRGLCSLMVAAVVGVRSPFLNGRSGASLPFSVGAVSRWWRGALVEVGSRRWWSQVEINTFENQHRPNINISQISTNSHVF